MKLKDLLPAAISFGNMGCGFAAIICLFGEKFEYAGWLIILATVLDIVDGKVARIANSTSKFGSQLDSLVDLVTFGVVPAIMIGRACTGVSPIIVWSIGFFFVVTATIRLAKFSSEAHEKTLPTLTGTACTASNEAHHQTFTGLPTTSAGGAIASLLILNSYLHTHFATNVVLVFLPAIAIVLSVLMVSRVRHTHAKVFFTPKYHGTVPFILKAVSSTVFFVLFPQVAVSAAFCCYAISGLLSLLKEKVFTSHPDAALPD